MALDDLKEVVEKLQLVIRTYKTDYLLGKERRTRQMLIDPLLKVLGWDVLDPGAVYLEHNKMDYALMSNAIPVAVIEAKPLGESLEKKAITQAITYAVENTIPYIIVTNGDRWEMYEVFKQADLEDKKLMAFQLSEQSAQECALQALRIWNPNLASGSPKEAGKPVFERPETEQDSANDSIDENVKEQNEGLPSNPSKLTAFTFRDQQYKINKDYEYLVKFSEILHKKFGDRFKKKVLELRGPNGAVWFSEEKGGVRRPRLISEAGIYVASHFETKKVKERVKLLAELFDVEKPLPVEE